MKHILLLVLMFTLLPVQAIFANTVVRSGETVTLTANQSVEGSFYVVGGTVALSGKITGDTTVIGGNVTVGGEITEDLAILAGTVSLQSPVLEDVRIVAGQVTITEDITGNLVVVAGKLNISSDAKITGDVLFYGGELVAEGVIGGKLMGTAETVRVDNEITGGIDMSVRHLTLGEQAQIKADVSYVSDYDVVRAPGATVSGEVVKNATASDETPTNNNRFIAIFFLISMFASLSLYLCFRNKIESFGKAVRSSLLIKTVVGFICVFMAPLLIIILIVSMLGSLVGLIALCLFALLLTLTFPLMAVTAGSLISSLVDPKAKLSLPYLMLGGVVVHALMLLPVLGAAVLLLLYLATVGAIIDQLYKITR